MLCAMPLPFRAILFDLDDTLWPIAPVIARAELRLFGWREQPVAPVAARFSIDALRQRRVDLLAQEPRYHLDLGALRRSVLEQAFREAGADPARVAEAMTVFFAARNDVVLYDDVVPALQQLGRRMLVGAIS